MIFAIQSSEGLGQAIDGATDDADVVRALQVLGQHRLGGEVLEILGVDFPAVPLALAMLCSLEQVLDPVVRPRHEPDPAAGALRQAWQDQLGTLRGVFIRDYKVLQNPTSNRILTP